MDNLTEDVDIEKAKVIKTKSEFNLIAHDLARNFR
jgi:hypothetical protein